MPKQTPSTVPPYLVAALICDVACVDPSSGKKNLIGIFSQLNVARFPTARPISLYVKISDAEGFYPFVVEFVHLNTDQVLAAAEGELTVADRKEASDFLIDFPPLVFPEPGRYEFRIRTNEMYVGNAFLDALERPLPPKARTKQE